MTRLAPIQANIPYWKIPQLKNSAYAAIPWEEHIEIWKNYFGSNQTPEKIAERGGFGIKESAKYYKMNPIVVWFSKGEDYPESDEGWIKVKITFENGKIYFENYENTI